MIYDLRFAICATERSCNSVRSDIFLARVDAQEIKPRRGDIKSEILPRNIKWEAQDVAPTELCSLRGAHYYNYAAPDGAGFCRRENHDRRTV